MLLPLENRLQRRSKDSKARSADFRLLCTDLVLGAAQRREVLGTPNRDEVELNEARLDKGTEEDEEEST